MLVDIQAKVQKLRDQGQSLEEVLAAIEGVTHDDVRRVAMEVLDQPKVLAVVGPFDDDAPFAAALCGRRRPRAPCAKRAPLRPASR